MNKSAKYAINGALLGAIVNSALNALRQNNNSENSEFDWESFFGAMLKGGAIGGVGGFVIGAIRDNEMSKTLLATGGTIGFINSILENYSDAEDWLPKKAHRIQQILYKEYEKCLSEYPSISGSQIRGTAIQNSDIDIQIRFNKKAGGIREIRETLEGFLKTKYEDDESVNVRSQEHSIGLLFEKGRIDIVPMREIENGQGDTYIYSQKNDSIKKTNAYKQFTHLTLTDKQKQIIRLLKGWKSNNDLRLPSTIIEHIIQRMFKDESVPRGLDKALLFSIEYLGNNIKSIRIVDPANTNNIISDSITENEKSTIQNFCNMMLNEIGYDERNILDFFHLSDS